MIQMLTDRDFPEIDNPAATRDTIANLTSQETTLFLIWISTVLV